MAVICADGKQRDGDERGIGDELLSSPLGKRAIDRSRDRSRDPVAAAVPATEFSPDESRSSRSMISWVTSTKFINFLILVAVVCHGWSSHQAAKGLTYRSLSQVLTAPQVVANHSCSGNGNYESEYETGRGSCRCHPCFTGADCSSTDTGCIVNVFQGDPTMFEKYWLHNADSCKTEILGWHRMSYYADSKQFFFVQTELDVAIRSLHAVVGNAVTEGRHIVIGTGSTQLFQAALYALSSPSRSTPTEVVSLAPYYSAYPPVTDLLRSGLYRWAGDAATFKQTPEEDAYIEVVCMPNNPTGENRYPVVNGTGALIYDLAYYWPHHVPITAPADHEVMLFTLSKTTGHAGTRIGWAIVKDLAVAQKMAKFIELNTIGVSKDSQIRATQILRSISKGYSVSGHGSPEVYERATPEDAEVHLEKQALFHFGSSEMAYRWRRLRSALGSAVRFTIPEFQPEFCNFFGQIRTPTPAFAWLRCIQEEDCEKFLKMNGILTRGGVYFGADASFVRLSMIDRRSSFEILIDRVEALERAASRSSLIE